MNTGDLDDMLPLTKLYEIWIMNFPEEQENSPWVIMLAENKQDSLLTSSI